MPGAKNKGGWSGKEPTPDAKRVIDMPSQEPSQVHTTAGFEEDDAQRRKGTAESRGGNDREQMSEKGARGGV